MEHRNTLKRRSEAPPSPAARRITRNHGLSTINYDTKYHPMDAYTRPNAMATQRALHAHPDQKVSVVIHTTAQGISAVQDHEDIKYPATTAILNDQPSEPEAACRRSSRHSLSTRPPIYDTNWHPADLVLHPRKRMPLHKSRSSVSDAMVAIKTPNEKPTGDPCISSSGVESADDHTSFPPADHKSGLRRSLRPSVTNGPCLRYDMHYHPIDESTRPRAAAKRRKVREEQSRSDESVPAVESCTRASTSQDSTPASASRLSLSTSIMSLTTISQTTPPSVLGHKISATPQMPRIFRGIDSDEQDDVRNWSEVRYQAVRD